jgi:hypothetical protein
VNVALLRTGVATAKTAFRTADDLTLAFTPLSASVVVSYLLQADRLARTRQKLRPVVVACDGGRFIDEMRPPPDGGAQGGEASIATGTTYVPHRPRERSPR